MADKLKFELVSPERVLASLEADMVVVPGGEGHFGVQPEHAPFMSTVRPGVIDVHDGGRITERIFVEGGFAEVNPEGLIVLASPDDVRTYRVHRELPERVSTAVVLGHEPTMSEVLHEVVSRWQFAGGPPDAFPTCTMAFIEFKKPWADLKPGHGRLVRFEIPRG